MTSRLLPSRPPASHPEHATPRPCCGVHDAAVVPPPPSPKQRQSSLSLRLPLLFPPGHLHVGLGAMPSTAESPHRAAAGREEGEGPISPPTRGHKGGRKVKNATTEFTAVPGVGGTCLHCHMLVKTKQQSGTILAQHLFGCRLAPSIQQVAWDACSTLQKCKTRPLDSSDAAARPAPGVSGIRGGASGAGSVVFSPQLLGSQRPGVGITAFLDRVSPAQASTI